MAARIPVRFERVAAAFEADVARVRLCESSGSEHSPETSSADLSELVKSFMERAGTDQGEELDRRGMGEEEDIENLEWSDSDKRDMLQELLFVAADIHDQDDRNAKERIKREAELFAAASRALFGANSSPGFKRRLMSSLRETGFDAGLCKSKWEKNKRFPGGDHEYVDVNFGGNRYIVEVSLAAEFEIARPTNQYCSMLDVIPTVFVGKVEELKQVVRLMCTCIKSSMKSNELHIPPWRRNGYMQAKWFSSYRRTTNEVATTSQFSSQRSIGFEAPLVNCRDAYDYGRKTAFRVGHLTAAFNAADGFGIQMQS